MPQPSPDRAKYRRIADDLREQIRGGVYAPGEYLPAEKDLAAEYDAARDTVREAFRLLVAEGLVSTLGGRRAQVRDRPEPNVVRVRRDRRIGARPATDEERALLGLPAGGWVLFEADAEGMQVELYPADRTLLEYGDQN